MEVVSGDNWTTGAISRAKLQSNHHHQQTNIQLFYKPDALPVAQPTVSKHRREKKFENSLWYVAVDGTDAWQKNSYYETLIGSTSCVTRKTVLLQMTLNNVKRSNICRLYHAYNSESWMIVVHIHFHFELRDSSKSCNVS